MSTHSAPTFFPRLSTRNEVPASTENAEANSPTRPRRFEATVGLMSTLYVPPSGSCLAFLIIFEW